MAASTRIALRCHHIKVILFNIHAMVQKYNYSLDGYVLCFRNVIYAGNVHRGILHFHLSLLKGTCTRVRRKTEAKNTVLRVSVLQTGPFWRLSAMASTEFGVVNRNLDEPWYGLHIIRLNSSCFMQQFVIV